jgi:putative oxidoreductase
MAHQVYSEQDAVPTALPATSQPAAPTAARHRIVSRISAAAGRGEAAILGWLVRNSIAALRISLGAVLLGFGVLKYFPGMSPAQSLVLATLHLLTLGLVPALVPGVVAMAAVATLECVIGLLLILGRRMRLAVVLMAVHLTGILSPVVLLPSRMFAGPDHMPTLEGQYVLKDVVLLTAGMVIAAAAGGGALVSAAAVDSP